ncbi:MAG: NADP-dependent isocitrate dehydrogenase [Phycisphaeraceae bacterium]|nr:MAG: NADP-dependent isocitrate dehydrogenase [Phycisphaeraceae bacterium]
MANSPRIIYTITDEAPALATVSFLPILRRFAAAAGVDVETRDISLAARILCKFPERMSDDQRVADDLAELGAMCLTPEANIIKLPNISASMPQMKAAIAELQSQGSDLPNYPDHPANDEERDFKARYDSVKGSAVNPVLREGNSDRRAPSSVKAYARANPHRMGKWSTDSDSHVSSMTDGDFFSHEQSVTMAEAGQVHITFTDESGNATELRAPVAVEAGEVVDSSFMCKASLTAFLQKQVACAKDNGVLFSLHMKATMMKVSDPIIFGHGVRAWFAPLFEKYGETFATLGVNPNNGFGDAISKMQGHADEAAFTADVAEYLSGIAMVDSDRGITNLHVPSDVIIDASMPAMLRDSGCMWNTQGERQAAKAVIPDRTYAGVYAAVVEDCKANGAYDPTTMGSVPNVGLMAKKAEEYGSHDKTFEMSGAGTLRVATADGTVLMEHAVREGDIWRMCQTKDAPIRDWVELALRRAKATGSPAVFWLDRNRAHDAELLKKVEPLLAELGTDGLDIHILAPAEACRFSLERIRRGEDTISVTGNVLRDYLTDLFPILEVGTSAKMLSIVPLMNGGGLFETGAGGSAPKHVQQVEKENHLRWDSLGEFMALGASFEHLANATNNPKAKVLGTTIDTATERYLMENRAPSRKAGELDNRGTHVYVAAFWAQALAEQTDDADLAAHFAPLSETMNTELDNVIQALNDAQGDAVDLGGYFRPDATKANAVMRPVAMFNELLEAAGV